MARYAYIYFMADDPARVRSIAPRHTEHWHSLNLVRSACVNPSGQPAPTTRR